MEIKNPAASDDELNPSRSNKIMKSNFIELHKLGATKLFEAIYSAEKLFVEQHYHFVPTAIRSFCEGVLLIAMNKQANPNRPELLVDLLNEFSQKYNRPNIKSAADRIRKFGNKSSHYEPIYWSEKDLIVLFKDAVKLQNFLICDFYKEDVNPVEFSRDALPHSENLIDRDEKEDKLNELANQIDLSKKLSMQLTEYRDKNRQLNDRLRLYQYEESKMAHMLQAERQVFQRKIAVLEEELKKEKESLDKERDGLLEQIKGEQREQNEKVMPNLTLEQKKLVDINEGRHFLIAPPGAGKTMILTQRLRTALENYDDSEILCLTFTTRAAQEMQERASLIINELAASDGELNQIERCPFIGNFHAFCLDQIRNSKKLGKTLDLKFNNFGILDDEYRDAIWHQALVNSNEADQDSADTAWVDLVCDFQEQLKSRFATLRKDNTNIDNFRRVFFDAYTDLLLLKIIKSIESKTIQLEIYPQIVLNKCRLLRKSVLKNLRLKVEKLLVAAFRVFGEKHIDVADLAKKIWLIFSEFQLLKAKSQNFDFDDIVGYGLAAIILAQQHRAFIQVDEVQDLSPIQWEILDALCEKQTHLFVVGDPEQSIYGFLGADIKALKEKTKGFHLHSLIANFRSEPKIVDLLNHYRKIHWELPTIKARKDVSDEKSTLLIKYPDDFSELNGNIFAVMKILEDPQRNVGLLLSTNKAVDSYCEMLQAKKVTFFRVGQFDLMQKPVIQDWLSLLRVSQGLGTRKDWWRLIYRFSISDFKDNRVTQASAMQLVNRLYDLGVSVHDVTSDWISKTTFFGKTKPNLCDHRVKQLITWFNTKGVVVFDTETTSLNHSKAKIVQIAAVRVVQGEVIETFDKYIKLDFEKNPDLKKEFKESQKIHRIDEDMITILPKENRLTDVLDEFIKFVDESPLVAHNLTFDKTILRHNLYNEAEGDYQLLIRYQKMQNNLQFDSLNLVRILFPNLESYKLGNLLKEFNLEGINSHNALDDVKATASLLSYLVKKLESRLNEIDAVILEFNYLVEPLVQHWSLISRLLRDRIESDQDTEFDDILIDWLNYAEKQTDWYGEESLKLTRQEIELKLIPWLNKNDYRGVFSELMNVSNPKVEKLFTLKESDLIDEKEHRVVVSTVHRAKGLEFDSVIVAQTTDSAYPPWSPDGTPLDVLEKRKQEACRLLYVAMSRPKRKLIVTYHTKFKTWPKSITKFLEGFEHIFSWTQNN